MPNPHIFLPLDDDRSDLAAREEVPRQLDSRRKAGMPGDEKRLSAFPCRSDERSQFTNGRAGWLFEQHMLAGLQRSRRQRRAHLRRRADCNSIDFGCGTEQFFKRRKWAMPPTGGLGLDAAVNSMPSIAIVGLGKIALSQPVTAARLDRQKR
jgi:hypothetical protein